MFFHEYLLPIQMVYALFPLIIAIFSIPYIPYQRRRYGRIHFGRLFIMYSFVLYITCMYFYIITPLPPFDYVLAHPLPVRIELRPFAFLYDFTEQAYWVLSGIGTVNVSHSAWFQTLGNIAFFLPFGFYLRYYFRRGRRQTLILALLLSLFFELTQLTALYGIYPAPYRVFDINDLLLNTLGAVCGYQLTPVLNRRFSIIFSNSFFSF